MTADLPLHRHWRFRRPRSSTPWGTVRSPGALECCGILVRNPAHGGLLFYSLRNDMKSETRYKAPIRTT